MYQIANLNTKDRAEALLSMLENKRAECDTLMLDQGYSKRQADLDADMAADEKLATLKAEAEELESELRATVASVGESVKGAWLSVVYSPGRVSWDTKALDRLAERYSEISACRKTGNPTTSIKMASK